MKKFIQFLVAGLIIVIGVVLILDNLGFETINMENAWGLIFPVIFILLGGMLVVKSIRRKNSGWVWGLFFITYGALLLLGHYDYLEFTFKDLIKLWPVIIIYTGVIILGHTIFKKPYIYYVKPNKKDKKHYKKYSKFSVGDHEYNQPNWKVEPMELSNLAGDFYLDFTKAFIPEEEIPISIDALAGDVHILIPTDVEFRVNASVSAGEINVVGQNVGGVGRTLQYETVGYETATRKLNLTLKLKAGDIRVDQV